MALQKEIITDIGFVAETAYIKINSVAIIGKTKLELVVTISKDSNSKPFDTLSYQCDYDILGDNPLAQGYEHLKTLDGFKDAEDV